MGRLVICSILLALAAGCTRCPRENVLVPAMTPCGPLLLSIPAGTLDDSDNYFTEEEFKKLMEEEKYDRVGSPNCSSSRSH